MLRLFRYLKPYTLLILLTIALLFIQANADLALPDYMSRLVNIGIQQGGVESAVPQVVRQSTMTKLLLFLSSEEQHLVLATYTRIVSDAPAYQAYLQEYPALNGEAVYVLQTTDQAILQRLNPILARAFLIVGSIEQMLTDAEKAESVRAQLGFDLSKFPSGADPFALLQRMPPEQIAHLRAALEEKLAALGEKMVLQMAAPAVKREFEALGVDMGKLQMRYLLRVGFSMLGLTLLVIACTILVSLLSARTAAGAARDLRRDVFQKVESFSGAELDRFSTASLITRSTNDVTQLQMVVVMMMRMVFYAPIIGIGGIIRALGKSASMWWIIALAVLVLLGLILLAFSIALPRFTRIQSLIDRLNLVLRENLTGIMVVRAFNRQQYEEERFDHVNRDLTSTMLFVNRVMAVMMPAMMLIMNGLSLLILWVGAHQVANATMQVGDMMAFLQYAMQIVFSFLMLSIMFIILPRASVSGERIAEVLTTEPTIHDPEQPKHFPEPFRGAVEFRHVHFRYPNAEEDVLHDIHFTARPGETTAIIGSTGSGKSTIVNLIPRFYDVTAGAILIDGVDIREVSQRELREKIGYVPQKGILFSGTIETNLRYADENADPSVLEEAIAIAQADDFVFANPAGLATEIAQGGTNVSGGQKQRLSMARALARRAPIYIFDDSFSALDFKTDAALRRAIRKKLASSTVFIVSQRVATIKNADQILVLDEGRIVGRGTHNELMKNCEVYRDIAISQLGEEEQP